MKHAEWIEYEIDVLTRRTMLKRSDLESLSDEDINKKFELWAAGYHF